MHKTTGVCHRRISDIQKMRRIQRDAGQKKWKLADGGSRTLWKSRADKAKRREKTEEAAADGFTMSSPSRLQKKKNSDGAVVFLSSSHSCGCPGGWWEQGLGGRSITRQTGQISVARGLLAGGERRAGFGADVDQTLAGLEACQRLGAR